MKRSDQYITVSELIRALNSVMEEALSPVAFSGEISELKKAASGHIYFTVKDEESQIAAVMWRGMAAALNFVPAVGMEVLCHGKPNIYHRGGRLQIVVHKLLQAGEGLLQQRFLELKAKLEREGLFAEERKRELPFFPRKVGIVTSRAGAAIHDIMTKLRERMPNLEAYLVDVRVQGEGAAEEIAQAINFFSEQFPVDVLIVGRGGGSLEDLWSFNEEQVVRAIFASKIPVISGVGHEVDVTLSDLVADCRAPTPTAAAEMAVPKRSDLLEDIAALEDRLLDTDYWFQPLVQELDDLSLKLSERIATLIDNCRLRLKAAQAKATLLRPDKVLEALRERLNFSQRGLNNNYKQRMLANRQLIDELEGRLKRALGPNEMELFSERVRYAEANLVKALSDKLKQAGRDLSHFEAKLEALNPGNVLQRGFAMVRGPKGLVRSVADLKKQDEIQVQLARGLIEAKVEKLRE